MAQASSPAAHYPVYPTLLCLGPKTSLAGAFFTSRRMFLNTSFPDANTIEESSGYNMFHRNERI